MKNRKGINLLIASLLLFLAACSQEKEDISEKKFPVFTEKTSNINELPSFLDNTPENVILAYKAAAKEPELLQYLPCYCGCGESVGHKSNLECFINEVKNDGEVVWDTHGVNCQTCIDIALQSVSDKINGQSNKTIRNKVDHQYKEGYPAPTDTEMPH